MQEPTAPLAPAAAQRRKRQRRKDDRPAEIIAAAMALWAEKGFAATRLEDVARSAGVAKGTIYLYFPSKEALFEAAVNDRLATALDRAAELTPGFDGPTEALLQRFFAAISDQMFEAGGALLIRVLIVEGRRFPDLMARYRRVAMARGMAAIRAILARGAARGDLRADAAGTDPRLIMAPVMMAALWDMLFGPSPAPDRAALQEAHLALLLQGLAQRPQS